LIGGRRRVAAISQRTTFQMAQFVRECLLQFLLELPLFFVDRTEIRRPLVEFLHVEKLLDMLRNRRGRVGGFIRHIGDRLCSNDRGRLPAAARVGFRAGDCRTSGARTRALSLARLLAARCSAKEFFNLALQRIAGRSRLALRRGKLTRLHYWLLKLRNLSLRGGTGCGGRRTGGRRAASIAVEIRFTSHRKPMTRRKITSAKPSRFTAASN